VAVQASREVVIDAPPDVIMEALGDIDVLSEWSPLHKRVEVLDRYPDGRPHHVKACVKVMGFVDKEILEYHWGPNWVVYDAKETFRQRGQHIEYRVQPEGVNKCRVRFDITVEPSGPVPDFIVKRATKSVLDATTEGLRKWVVTKTAVQYREG
jgi:Polyketide cyclase / dehydrase and lipid transport